MRVRNRVSAVAEVPVRDWALIVALVLPCLAGCGDARDSATVGEGSPEAAATIHLADGADTDEAAGDDVTPAGDSPVGSAGPWDPDGDGISTAVETDGPNRPHGLDPTVFDPDPSKALGLPWQGALEGDVNLPDVVEGEAYYHFLGSDGSDTDDWATVALVRRIEATSRCWSSFLESTGRARPRIGVGDLSVRGGGEFVGHKTHQNGLDVDVRYVRSDGTEDRLDVRPPVVGGDGIEALDVEGSAELFACFLAAEPPVEFILVDARILDQFEDWTGGRIRSASGHHHHFHVRIQPGPWPPPGEQPPGEQPEAEPEVDDPEPHPGGRRSPGTRVDFRPPERRPLPPHVLSALVRRDAVVRLGVDSPSTAATRAARARMVHRATVAADAGLAGAAVTRPAVQEADTTNLVIRVDRVGPQGVVEARGATSRVQVQDEATGTRRTIYTAPDRVITSVRIAPSEAVVGFLEQDRASNTSDLVVLDRTGAELLRRPDVRQFALSPGGTEVLQVTGSAAEGGVGYRPEGLVLSNPSTGVTSRVAVPGTAYRVEWARFDSAAYIETLVPVDGVSVFRLDPRTGALQPTTHRSVDFSPDGRYYLDEADEIDPVTRVYETRGDRLVSIPDSLGVPTRWVYGKGSFLLFTRSQKQPTGRTTPSGIRLTRVSTDHVVWDVASSRVVQNLDTLPNVHTSADLIPQVRANRLQLMRRP